MRSTPAMLLAAAMAAGLMTGCATFERSRPPEPSRPLADPCPASLTAPLDDEPLAPEGFAVDALPAPIVACWFGDYLPGSRDLARRLSAGQAWCAGR